MSQNLNIQKTDAIVKASVLLCDMWSRNQRITKRLSAGN